MGFMRRILGYGKLESDEEKAVGLLRHGPMRQKELIQQLGMNPVKFNKLIRSLEEKGIAKREPHGRENVVRLV